MEAPWADTLEDASRIQRELAPKVRIRPFKGSLAYIAGADAAYTDTHVVGAACLYTYPEIEFIEAASFKMEIPFPYESGFLAFRDGPAIAEAIRRLRNEPDIVIIDGHGIAHPEGIGLASHIGVALGLPTIGSAKTVLVGTYKEPGMKRGSRSSLLYDGEHIGFALRTRSNVKPVYVSPGHMVDMESAAEVVLACATRFRLPEPIRCAHARAGAMRILKYSQRFFQLPISLRGGHRPI